MTKASESRCRRGHTRGLTLAALAVLVSACSGEDGGGAPFTGCPRGVPQAPPTGPETVLAGGRYSRALGFPTYPCAKTVPDCLWIPGLPPLCTTTEVQGECSPGLALLRGPGGASTVGQEVRWQTARADEGVVAEFEVAAQYPAGCTQERRAWTVTVLSAPPPPVLRSVSLDRDHVRAGDRVTVVAEFEGTASWWNGVNALGALESGVPASATLSFAGDQPITVRVENAIGEVAEETRVVRVWGLPSVRITGASPARFVGAADVQLSWEASEASSIVVTPAPDSSSTHYATRRISETTTFVVTASNPFGDVATDTVTVTKVEPAALHGFSALAAEVAVGDSPSFVATFSNGTARLYAVRGGSAGATSTSVESLGVLESGVRFVAPPQRGTDLYRVVVTDDATAGVSAELLVTTTGPGSFRPLATGGAATAPLLASAPDGRLLVLTKDPLKPSQLFPALLDVDAATVTTSASGISSATTALAVLGNGRAVASGWARQVGLPANPFLSFDPAHAVWWDWIPFSDVSQFGPKALVPLDGGAFFSAGESAAWLLDVDAPTSGRMMWGVSPGPACRLADGRVLTVGGRVIYDPVADTVGSPFPDPVQRSKPSILCLSGGGALLVGGVYPTDRWATEIERFDPVSSSWTVLPVTAPRQFSAGVELTPGKVLLLTWDEGWVLDLATNAFARAGRFTFLRSWSGGSLSAVRLPDGRAVIHGSGGPVPELFTP